MTSQQVAELLLSLRGKTVADELLHEVIAAAVRYARLRVDWAMSDRLNRLELDSTSTAAHNVFIDSCNALSRASVTINVGDTALLAATTNGSPSFYTQTPQNSAIVSVPESSSSAITIRGVALGVAIVTATAFGAIAGVVLTVRQSALAESFRRQTKKLGVT